MHHKKQGPILRKPDRRIPSFFAEACVFYANKRIEEDLTAISNLTPCLPA
jgi:hypothetical protein